MTKRERQFMDYVREHGMSAQKRTAKDLAIHIRWMIRRDMPEVIENERISYDYPWSNDDFMDVLRQRNTIGLIAETTGYPEMVIGHVLYELYRGKFTLLNVTVSPAWRRRNVGARLMEFLKRKLSHSRRNRIEIVVRESNLEGQKFLASQAFKAHSILREHFNDTGEDGYLFIYKMPSILDGQVDLGGEG